MWLVIFLLALFIVYAILVYNIELYNVIYLDSNNTQVVVLNKNLLNTTISFIDSEPITVSTIYFLINYHQYA